MAISVRDVLEKSLLAQAEPQVVAGGAWLDNAVRWAHASERYDVAAFLEGGELILVEGSALFGHLSAGEQERYIDALADMAVSGLVMELVEGLRQVPDALRAHAEERGMPIIGLHARIPFIGACQSVNTLIIRDQILLQQRVDVLSNALRRELLQATSVQQMAATLARVFGEHVAIFDVHGAAVASAGPRIPGSTTLIDVRPRARAPMSIELSQHVRIFDDETRRLIAHVCIQVLERIAMPDASVAMGAALFVGADGTDASDDPLLCEQETRRTLAALGLSGKGGGMWMPFAIGVRSLERNLRRVMTMIERWGEARGVRMIAQLHGSVVWCVAAYAQSGGCVAAEKAGESLLQGVVAELDDVWAVGGRATDEPTVLAGSLAVLRGAVRAHAVPWNTVSSLYDVLPAQCTQAGSVERATRMLQAVMLGDALRADTTLLVTLAAVFDAGGNRTHACETLSIGRQTFYNRLDKVQRHIAVGPDAGRAWSLLLLAASTAVRDNLPW